MDPCRRAAPATRRISHAGEVLEQGAADQSQPAPSRRTAETPREPWRSTTARTAAPLLLHLALSSSNLRSGYHALRPWGRHKPRTSSFPAHRISCKPVCRRVDHCKDDGADKASRFGSGLLHSVGRGASFPHQWQRAAAVVWADGTECMSLIP